MYVLFASCKDSNFFLTADNKEKNNKNKHFFCRNRIFFKHSTKKHVRYNIQYDSHLSILDSLRSSGKSFYRVLLCLFRVHYVREKYT